MKRTILFLIALLFVPSLCARADVNPSEALEAAFIRSPKDAIAALESHPELVNTVFEDLGQTPLINACSNVNSISGGTGDPTHTGEDYVPVVKWLLAHGAKVDATDKGGATALHKACVPTVGSGLSTLQGTLEVARLLIAKGAPVNAKDVGGQTPLHLACATRTSNTGPLVALLLSNGADLHLKDSSGASPIADTANLGAAQILVDHGADVRDADNDGITSLHIAANNGSVDLVEFLIEKGADVNAKTHDGKTAMMLAKEQNNDKTVDTLKRHGAK